MDNGSRPVLFTHTNIPWHLIPASSLAIQASRKCFSRDYTTCDGEVQTLLNKLDPELAAIWTVISDFCSRASAAVKEEAPKLTEEAFLHSMGSTMYRLLHQRYRIGSPNEAFRLGLLAFSSPIYLHWNRVELPDHRFNAAYRRALVALKSQTIIDVTPREWTWLLTVGALSMLHEPESIAWLMPQLRENLLLFNVCSWTHMRDLLSSFLWIGLVYDEQGSEIYEKILLLGQ
jgi:hypothetical protein